MHVILLGAPGSGKGTQASLAAEQLGISHIASGDLFRAAVKRGDELGNKVKSYMEKGLLVPDEVTIKMIMERISEPDCAKGFMLDGFQRTLEQAKALDGAMGERGAEIDRVVYINVSTDELVRRLGGRFICRECQTPYHIVSSAPKTPGKCDKCGGELYQRADDTPETVKKRIDVYLADTAPLIDYYRASNKLVEVSGEGDIDSISESLIRAITKD